MTITQPLVLRPESFTDRFVQEGWAVCDGFFSPDVVAQLAFEAQAGFGSGEFHPARVGRADNRALHSEIRQDHICWLEPQALTEAQQTYWQMLERLRLDWNLALFLGLFSYEAHFALFPQGAHYLRHLDQFQALGRRSVSCILYLTDAWVDADGGALRLFLPQGHRDIYPVAGRLVCFLSDRFYHQVNPASRQRLSLTGWFCKRAGLPDLHV